MFLTDAILKYMTDIPGTGKVQPLKKHEEVVKVENTTVVNIKELKKKDFQKERPEDKLWYNQLKYWLLISLGISLLFLLISLTYSRFIYISPLPPILSYITWNVRRLVRKLEKIDIFAK